jgi:hypothetical protein
MHSVAMSKPMGKIGIIKSKYNPTTLKKSKLKVEAKSKNKKKKAKDKESVVPAYSSVKQRTQEALAFVSSAFFRGLPNDIQTLFIERYLWNWDTNDTTSRMFFSNHGKRGYFLNDSQRTGKRGRTYMEEWYSGPKQKETEMEQEEEQEQEMLWEARWLGIEIEHKPRRKKHSPVLHS